MPDGRVESRPGYGADSPCMAAMHPWVESQVHSKPQGKLPAQLKQDGQAVAIKDHVSHEQGSLIYEVVRVSDDPRHVHQTAAQNPILALSAQERAKARKAPYGDSRELGCSALIMQGGDQGSICNPIQNFGGNV